MVACARAEFKNPFDQIARPNITARYVIGRRLIPVVIASLPSYAAISGKLAFV